MPAMVQWMRSLLPVADEPTWPVTVDEPTRIAADLLCNSCDYNLRGLEVGGDCPECGEAVALTWNKGMLCLADLGWLGRIRAGLWLIGSIGPATLVVIPFSIILRIICFFVDPSRHSQLLTDAYIALALVVGVYVLGAYALGTWLLTSVERDEHDEALVRGRSRRLTRWSGLLAPIVFIAGVGFPITSFVDFAAVLSMRGSLVLSYVCLVLLSFHLVVLWVSLNGLSRRGYAQGNRRLEQAWRTSIESSRSARYLLLLCLYLVAAAVACGFVLAARLPRESAFIVLYAVFMFGGLIGIPALISVRAVGMSTLVRRQLHLAIRMEYGREEIRDAALMAPC